MGRPRAAVPSAGVLVERVIEVRPSESFRCGSRVYHQTFGDGLVLETEGTGRDERLTIEFPDVGRKVVVARFVERR